MTPCIGPRALVVALAGLVLLGACGDPGQDLATPDPADAPPASRPERPADYAGVLTSVMPFAAVTEGCVEPGARSPDEPVSSEDPPVCTDPASAPEGTVLVEERPGVQEGDKISLRIDAGTALLAEGGSAGGSLEPVSFADLAEGQSVQVWVTGAVADSYPQQGMAEALVVAG